MGIASEAGAGKVYRYMAFWGHSTHCKEIELSIDYLAVEIKASHAATWHTRRLLIQYVKYTRRPKLPLYEG